VTGIPLNGQVLYVRLWTLVGGIESFVDYTYTRSDSATQAVLVSPDPTQTVATSAVAFSWTSVTGATRYWLDVGTSAGGTQIYTRSQSGTSATVTGIPLNGQALYVRLWTLVGGIESFVDYTYTRADSATQAVLVSPDPTLTVATSAVAFSWTSVSGAQAYWLDVGTALGGQSLHNSGALTATSRTVTGIPLDGQTLYVRLWTRRSDAWLYVDYLLARANSATQAVLVSPDPTLTVTTSAVAFSWTSVSGAQAYWLDVGTTLGGQSLHNSGALTATSRTVTGIPLDGQTLYVRLWTQRSNVWLYVDYLVARANSAS
jgi:hypothetical protein